MHYCRYHGTEFPEDHFIRSPQGHYRCIVARRNSHAKYEGTEKAAKRFQRYQRSERGKARQFKYDLTEAGRARFTRYQFSEKGPARSFRRRLRGEG